jgi:hypothetical protein
LAMRGLVLLFDAFYRPKRSWNQTNIAG